MDIKSLVIQVVNEVQQLSKAHYALYPHYARRLNYTFTNGYCCISKYSNPLLLLEIRSASSQVVVAIYSVDDYTFNYTYKITLTNR